MTDLETARDQARRWREYAKGNGRTRKGRSLARAARAQAEMWQREAERLAAPTQTIGRCSTVEWKVTTMQVVKP